MKGPVLVCLKVLQVILSSNGTALFYLVSFPQESLDNDIAKYSLKVLSDGMGINILYPLFGHLYQ